MKLIARSVILLFIAGSVNAQSPSGQPEKPPQLGEDAAMEFQIKKEMLEDRVADFYTRLILLERESRAREQGAEEMRKQRAKFKQEYEAARREYIQQRQAKREPDPSAHEKELREQRERYERARRDYVRRRDEMRRFEKSVGGIPEYVEYDIDLDPLTETE